MAIEVHSVKYRYALFPQVTWILDQESMRRRYLLLSLGNDGKVLIWELVSNQKELKLQRGLRLLTESVPRSIRVSKAKGDAEIGGGPLAITWVFTTSNALQALACPSRVKTRTCFWWGQRMEASTSVPCSLCCPPSRVRCWQRLT